MASLLPRRAPYVCKACQSAQTPRAIVRAFATSTRRSASLREQLKDRTGSSEFKQKSSVTQKIGNAASRTFQKAQQATPEAQSTPPTTSTQVSNPQQALKEIQLEALSILESDQIPDEAAVQDLLTRAQALADSLAYNTQHTEPQPSLQETTSRPKLNSRSDLFGDLSEPSTSQPSSAPTATATTAQPSTTPQPSQTNHTLALPLAKTLYTLFEDPKLYISEPLLTAYTYILTTLRLPSYLPKIFHLYAHKPIPTPITHNPIEYTQPWSKSPKYAIPKPLSDVALDSAISVRDMPLCISIIDTTLNTPAFRRAKFVRKALLPLTLAGSVIPLSYSLSTRAAATQLSWEPETFFWMCMAGGTAYLGTMGALLFVTITAWNDHHKRVRWVPGMKLTKRWFKEEERAAFDRVAQAWGFKDENRHGEEGGEEWEGLREVLGARWLELDRSSLLPGML